MQNKAAGNTYLLSQELNSDEKIALVNDELQRLIEHFDRKADESKRNFQLYKYTSIILSVATTLVSFWQILYSSKFPLWILPMTSAGATVAVALLGASSAQKIWINSRTTQQQLQAEKFLFNQQAGKYSNITKEESLRIFSEGMIQIWNEGHGKWEQTVNER